MMKIVRSLISAIAVRGSWITKVRIAKTLLFLFLVDVGLFTLASISMFVDPSSINIAGLRNDMLAQLDQFSFVRGDLSSIGSALQLFMDLLMLPIRISIIMVFMSFKTLTVMAYLLLSLGVELQHFYW